MRRPTSAEYFEVVARRIRARARAMLAELPVEDPNVVWARRAALLAEIDGTPPLFVSRPVLGPRGIWIWTTREPDDPPTEAAHLTGEPAPEVLEAIRATHEPAHSEEQP